MTQRFEPSLQKLDDILLSLATLLELTDQDRKIAESRYERLKSHLSRESCEFSELLEQENSLIYAQGSMATSTTIVSGTDDDRFDVDAVVEIAVPSDWTPKQALDKLYDALENFPHKTSIERCTRCVQLQFANMHLDVTIIDNSENITGERPGKIFHSPDNGNSYSVPSNPWGFTDWFRNSLVQDQLQFKDTLENKRQLNTSPLLRVSDDEMTLLKAAEQEDLPPMIPARVDTQESVALKLLKRFINIQYEDTEAKRPPSIYLTKKAIDCGYASSGLSAQLYRLANHISGELEVHINKGTRPDERNPSYHPDIITDRWPRCGTDGDTDIQTTIDKMEVLKAQLIAVSTMPLPEAKTVMSELFGERITERMLQQLIDAVDTSDKNVSLSHASPVGSVITSQSEPSVAPRTHNFHCSSNHGNR
ncbi:MULTISPECIES: nucleotidyltransferase [Methylophaga]|jgi:hypothetical protein|uniref:nucleotidyltransferase domain-containing protein n=1 Tax=Methylophaga TaxID=40222 RepID=UPI000C55483E|nr:MULTISPECIES: nucleotidyltransferase [Methylophaga]MAX50597.1 nucleotidyltransferase [Methylophaga sp.]WVI84024.1 nucleotidyltransferase [Methylophaga thalassica]|tara:strand:- start:5827 stop:7089 length:1263 start_codon:yes stop_codon:yes gene_type:complete